MKYRGLLIIMFILLICGCQKKSTISVRSNTRVEKLYLEFLTLNSTSIIDSATRKGSADFNFNGSYPKGIYSLRYGDHDEDYVLFCYDKKPIVISIESTESFTISAIEGDSIADKFNEYVSYVNQLKLANEQFIASTSNRDSVYSYQKVIRDRLISYLNEADNVYSLIYLFTMLDKQDDNDFLLSIRQKVTIEPYATEMDIILTRNKTILDKFVNNH